MLFQIVGLYSEAKCKTKVNKVKYSLYFLDLNRNKMSFKKFNFGSDSNTFFSPDLAAAEPAGGTHSMGHVSDGCTTVETEVSDEPALDDH